MLGNILTNDSHCGLQQGALDAAGVECVRLQEYSSSTEQQGSDLAEMLRMSHERCMELERELLETEASMAAKEEQWREQSAEMLINSEKREDTLCRELSRRHTEEMSRQQEVQAYSRRVSARRQILTKCRQSLIKHTFFQKGMSTHIRRKNISGSWGYQTI